VIKEIQEHKVQLELKVLQAHKALKVRQELKAQQAQQVPKVQ
jgi:hypothetical protein